MGLHEGLSSCWAGLQLPQGWTGAEASSSKLTHRAAGHRLPGRPHDMTGGNKREGGKEGGREQEHESVRASVNTRRQGSLEVP